MSRTKDYKYKLNDAEGKLPKKGLVEIKDGIATYTRLLKPSEVTKYNLVDLNDFTKLAKYRSAADVTQLELSEATGLSLRTIQGWEIRGMNKAALDSAVLIADALKIKDLRDLLEDE